MALRQHALGVVIGSAEESKNGWKEEAYSTEHARKHGRHRGNVEGAERSIIEKHKKIEDDGSKK